MAKIHADFKFDTAATTTATPVMTFFKQKRGVCRDFTHFMISCLRSTGVAARYVIGYLVPRSTPGKQRPVGAEASHAWVALFVPGSGWIEIDPTNNVCLRESILPWDGAGIFPTLRHCVVSSTAVVNRP